MSLKDLLNAIHNNESLKLCKISPANRENERQALAADVEKFLQSGKKIKEIPSNFSTQKTKAA